MYSYPTESLDRVMSLFVPGCMTLISVLTLGGRSGNCYPPRTGLDSDHEASVDRRRGHPGCGSPDSDTPGAPPWHQQHRPTYVESQGPSTSSSLPLLSTDGYKWLVNHVSRLQREYVSGQGSWLRVGHKTTELTVTLASAVRERCGRRTINDLDKYLTIL